MIKPISNDDTVIELEEKVAPQSGTIADGLDNLGETITNGISQDGELIPLDTPTNVSPKMASLTKVKLALIAFNFLRLMSGASFTYYGWYFFSQAETIEKATTLKMETHGIYLLIFGSAIIAIALFGLFATYRKSAALLYIYGGLMFLVMLNTAAFLNMDTPLDVAQKSLLKVGVQNGLRKFNDTAVAEQLQFVQKHFECCGWNGPDDYQPILGLGRIPVSCCGQNSSQQIGHARDTCQLADIVYRSGCKTYTTNIKLNYWICAVAELSLLLFTYYLTYKIGKKYDAPVLP